MCEECDRMEELIPDTCRECTKFEDYHECSACFVITKLLRIREMMDNGEDIEPAVISLQVAQLMAIEGLKLGMPNAEHVMTVISTALEIAEPDISAYLGVEPAIYGVDGVGNLRPSNDKAHEQDESGHNPQDSIPDVLLRLAENLGGLLMDNQGLPPLIDPNPGKSYLN